MSHTKEQNPSTAASGPAIWDLVIQEVSEKFPSSSRVAASVVADMRERDKTGLERYGTRLQAHNGRDPLIDAYQEALDMVVYLRQAIEEGQPVHGLYDRSLGQAVAIKAALMVR